ncbi:hypothetical protein ACOLXF_002165 [Vibrio fluvialis]
MMMMMERLRFTWWNTGLTPPNQKKSNAVTQGYTAFNDILSELLTLSDFIGLCEVGKDDLDHIKSHLDEETWAVKSLLVKTISKKGYYDLCCIYRKDVLLASANSDTINALFSGTEIKAAQKISVTTKTHAPTSFALYLSHWPSRLRGKVDERVAAAGAIRNDFLKLPPDTLPIFMGDYNDSPFSESLNVHLQATKCYDAVQRSAKTVLYNPFWKLTVSDEKYTYYNQKNCKSFSRGTYYFSQGTADALSWYSFDQIILSGMFLGSSKWHLDEPYTQVIRTPTIVRYFGNTAHVDHYPITLHIVHP